MEPLIKVTNVTKTYVDSGAEVRALDNFSLEVRPDEDIAIVGPSGSGKTTLLEILGGLNRPTSGEVIIKDQNIFKLSDKDLSKFRNQTIGFVFQLFHLQDYFTALENVTLPMLVNGIKSKDAYDRAEELLEQVGLKERINHFPNQLSGGEMQRVSIARALANDPDIIMADEPTGKLDKKNADMVMDIFSEIASNGTSIIVITHDMNVAKRFKRVVELEHGKQTRTT